MPRRKHEAPSFSVQVASLKKAVVLELSADLEKRAVQIAFTQRLILGAVGLLESVVDECFDKTVDRLERFDLCYTSWNGVGLKFLL